MYSARSSDASSRIFTEFDDNRRIPVRIVHQRQNVEREKDDETMSLDQTDSTPTASIPTLPENEQAAHPMDRSSGNAPAGYRALWILTSVLSVITITSLILNLLIIRQVVEARRLAHLAIEDSISLLQDLETQVYTYDVVIDDTFIVDDSVPFQEVIPVVINEEMPFSTAVTASVNVGPFGRYPVTIPIGGNVPINLSFDVPVDETVPVYIEVPIHTEIPIEVSIAQTPLLGTLQDAESHLGDLLTELDRPLLWFLAPKSEAPPAQ
jgi:hypothetical protein